MTGALLQRLVPSVRGMIPAEGRAAIGSVIQLAQGANLVGPPPMSAAAVAGCKRIAGGRVPWQLVAAAVYAQPMTDPADLHDLVEAVQDGDLVAVLVEWCGRECAGVVMLAYLVLLTRELDGDGLGVLGDVFGPDHS